MRGVRGDQAPVKQTPLADRAELLAALTEAQEALQRAGRKFGEVGTRDIDIADHNARMDRALHAISAVLSKLAPHVYAIDASGRPVDSGGAGRQFDGGGNRCGCNWWLTKPCPSRNCPWQGKRPVDSTAGVQEVPRG